MSDKRFIQFKENNNIIGKSSIEDFRKFMGVTNCFIHDLIKEYNEHQEKNGYKVKASLYLPYLSEN